MENAVKLCGLWKQNAKNGKQQFLAGKVGPTARLVVFKNTDKKNDKSPDYTAYLVTPAKQDGKDDGGEEF